MARKTVAGTASDPTIDYVKLSLNGKDYRLAFDFNSLAVAEQETGMDMLRAVRFENLSVLQYRALLYAALLKAQPTITITDAGNLCTMANLGKITDGILSAYGISMPPVTVEVEKKLKIQDPNSLTENSGSDVGVPPDTI
jgi:hypothetical protein